MQFSLRTLFVSISAVAVYLAIVFAVPVIPSYICLLLVSFLMVPVIVTGVVYDRNYARTFWIGCAAWGAIPVLTTYFVVLSGGVFLPIYSPSDIDVDEGRILCIILATGHGLVFLSGVIAMAARRLIEAKNRGRQTEVAFDTSILHGRVTVGRLNSIEPEDE